MRQSPTYSRNAGGGAPSDQDGAEGSVDEPFTNDPAGFVCWLLAGKIKPTRFWAELYAQAIGKVEAFAKERGLNASCFYGNADEKSVEAQIRLLLKSGAFVAYDARWDKRFTQALACFLMFIKVGRVAGRLVPEDINRLKQPKPLAELMAHEAWGEAPDSERSWTGKPQIELYQGENQNEKHQPNQPQLDEDQVAQSQTNGSQSNEPARWTIVPEELVPQAPSYNVEKAEARIFSNDPDGFKKWLVKEGITSSLAEAKICAEEVCFAEDFVAGTAFQGFKLYGVDDAKTLEFRINTLLKEPLFASYNARCGGTPRRALRCFLAFIQAARVSGFLMPSEIEQLKRAKTIGATSARSSQTMRTAPQPRKTPARAARSARSAQAAKTSKSVGPDKPATPAAPVKQTVPVRPAKSVLPARPVAPAKPVSAGQKRRDQIAKLVADGFPNGVRADSIIDRNRIKRLYQERYSAAEPLSDEMIASVLAARGFVYNGKTYMLSEDAEQRLRTRCASLVSGGQNMLFYEELYKAHEQEYAQGKIFSADALHCALQSIDSELFFFKNYCSSESGITVESELLRAFGDDTVLSISELRNRLPYIPEDEMKQAFLHSEAFVWVRQGQYARLDGVEIDPTEVEKARQVIEDSLSRDGFASLVNVCIDRTLEDNPGLSESAARNALYAKYLASVYGKKRGSVITRRGDHSSTTGIMRSWCRAHDELTLEEMDDFEQDFLGRVDTVLLEVAFDTMLRIDAGRFVADSVAHFDVQAVDEAIALFVSDGIVPVASVTSFSSFPDAGLPWTPYLLESFVHRYSLRYQIDGGPTRSLSVGAIYPKSLKFKDYGELLSHVLADSGIDLEERSAGDYLVNKGFVARRSKLVRQASVQARKIRDMRK